MTVLHPQLNNHVYLITSNCILIDNFNKSKTQSKWNLIIVKGLKVKFSDKDLTSCYRNSGSMPVPKQFIAKPKSKRPLPPVFIAVPITAYVTSEESRPLPGRRRPRSVEPNILTQPITEANLEPCCIKPKVVRPMGYYPHRSWVLSLYLIIYIINQ